MKKLLLLSTIALLGFASCKKEIVEPTTYRVKYEVTGTYILAYFKDNVWRGKHKQHVNVGGHWEYEFEAKELDTAYLALYMGTWVPSQEVKATISINGKVVKDYHRIYHAGTNWGDLDSITYKIK